MSEQPAAVDLALLWQRIVDAGNRRAIRAIAANSFDVEATRDAAERPPRERR
jgi:hypothetical protein